ncbi:MAG TPA: hypothetical protein VNV15_00110 [Opitutaceae bacterium]|jgi:hypothetical protein|nr:hypothetical protein [Opitutaceae bacterium]
MRLLIIALLLVCLAAAGLGIYRISHSHVQAPSTAVTEPSGQPVPSGNEVAPTYASRLAALDANTSPDVRDLDREKILVDWIHKDRASALAFLRNEGFASLRLRAVAEAIAAQATAADFAAIAEYAEMPYDSLTAIGNFLGPDGTTQLIAATKLVDDQKLPPLAAATADLIAHQNLDAALRFANGLPTTAAQSSAYSSIIGELSGTNQLQEAQAVYASLPANIQAEDDLRFAHGTAIIDSNPAGALQELSAISDPHERTMAMVLFARKVEPTAPDAAINAILNSGLSPVGVMNHASRIITNWAAYDPNSAQSFIDSATGLSAEQKTTLRSLIHR